MCRRRFVGRGTNQNFKTVAFPNYLNLKQKLHLSELITTVFYQKQATRTVLGMQYVRTVSQKNSPKISNFVDYSKIVSTVI